MKPQEFFPKYFKELPTARYVNDETTGDKFAVVFEHDEDKVRLDIIRAYKKARNSDTMSAGLIFETLPVETGIRVRW